MDIAAFVLSLIAIVISVFAAWYARRQALAAEDSARDSTRSADAAQEVVSYQRDDVERSRVVFVLEPSGGDTHMLSHQGTDIAYGVHVDAGGLRVDGEVYDFEEFPPGQAERIYLFPSLASVTSHVTVSWHQVPDLSDERRTARLYVNR
jgi:hypothetical protein